MDQRITEDMAPHIAPKIPARYRPIRDYGVIGDCHGAALVSRNGSVDWCCLERFDNDPVLCAILDADQGGFFLIEPKDDARISREYVPGTNILKTRFQTGRGVVTITDFMPVGRQPESGAHDYVTLNSPHWLVRIVECTGGAVPLRVQYRPTIDFARRQAVMEAAGHSVLTSDGPCLYADVPFTIRGDIAEAEIELIGEDRLHFTLSGRPLSRPPTPSDAELLLQITRSYWEEWSEYCRYEGPHKDHVLRSALVLKLMTYSPTGALIAAPTTSLPESIGGERNWDYRYCWIRDASFTLYALSALGYSGEAHDFAGFLEHQCRCTDHHLQIMYGIGFELDLTERELHHLQGYCGSRPVRTGNAAYLQKQLDTTGELLDWAYLYQSMGGRFDKESRTFLRSVADYAAESWNEPGNGIWEVRSEPRHDVLSKMMCWTALDRALSMFGANEKWRSARDEILKAVHENGVDAKSGAITQTFNREGMDVAVLLAPQIGFPISPQTLKATIHAVENELQHGDYLYRYSTEDGLSGSEGAFVIASFWLVQAKLHAGMIDEAHEEFEKLLRCENDLGLYAEEIEPDSHSFLGNFPQAYTHLALILCATNMKLQREKGTESLHGSHADRARLEVHATEGWRAIWSRFLQTRRVHRIRSSRASILDESVYH